MYNVYNLFNVKIPKEDPHGRCWSKTNPVCALNKLFKCQSRRSIHMARCIYIIYKNIFKPFLSNKTTFQFKVLCLMLENDWIYCFAFAVVLHFRTCIYNLALIKSCNILVFPNNLILEHLTECALNSKI